MKKLLCLALLPALTACSAADTEPTHAAATDYLRQHANDPASYEAVRWGAPAAFTRRDSATAAAEVLSREYDALKGTADDDRRSRVGSMAIRLEAVTDTARVGTRLIHAYRGKNKLGATVFDSAQFVVYKNGQVHAL